MISEITAGPFLGVDETEARIFFQGKPLQAFRVEVTDLSNPSGPQQHVDLVSSPEGFGLATFSGLTKDTRYAYTILINLNRNRLRSLARRPAISPLEDNDAPDAAVPEASARDIERALSA